MDQNDDDVTNISIYNWLEWGRFLKKPFNSKFLNFYKTLSPAQLVVVFKDTLPDEVQSKLKRYFNLSNLQNVTVPYKPSTKLKITGGYFNLGNLVHDMTKLFQILHKNEDLKKYFNPEFIDFLKIVELSGDEEWDSMKDIMSNYSQNNAIYLICDYANFFGQDDIAILSNILVVALQNTIEKGSFDKNDEYIKELVDCVLLKSIPDNFIQKNEIIESDLAKIMELMIDQLPMNDPITFSLLKRAVAFNNLNLVKTLLDKGAILVRETVEGFDKENIYSFVRSPEMVDLISKWIIENPHRVQQGGDPTASTLKLEQVINNYIPPDSDSPKPIAIAKNKDMFLAVLRNKSLFELVDLFSRDDIWMLNAYVIWYLQTNYSHIEGVNSLDKKDLWEQTDILDTFPPSEQRYVLSQMSKQLNAQKLFKKETTINGKTITTEVPYGNYVLPSGKRNDDDEETVEQSFLHYWLAVLGATWWADNLPDSSILGLRKRSQLELDRLRQENTSQLMQTRMQPFKFDKNLLRIIALHSRQSQLCQNLQTYFNIPELIGMYLFLLRKPISYILIIQLYEKYFNKQDLQKGKQLLCQDINKLIEENFYVDTSPRTQTPKYDSQQQLILALRNESLETETGDLSALIANVDDINSYVVLPKEGKKVLPLNEALKLDYGEYYLSKFFKRDQKPDVTKKDGDGVSAVYVANLEKHGDLLEKLLKENGLADVIQSNAYKSEIALVNIVKTLKNPVTNKELQTVKALLKAYPNLSMKTPVSDGKRLGDLFLHKDDAPVEIQDELAQMYLDYEEQKYLGK